MRKPSLHPDDIYLVEVENRCCEGLTAANGLDAILDGSSANPRELMNAAIAVVSAACLVRNFITVRREKGVPMSPKSDRDRLAVPRRLRLERMYQGIDLEPLWKAAEVRNADEHFDERLDEIVRDKLPQAAAVIETLVTCLPLDQTIVNGPNCGGGAAVIKRTLFTATGNLTIGESTAHLPAVAQTLNAILQRTREELAPYRRMLPSDGR